ncbi:V-type ATP synthase subunit E [Capillibacterium thermochitinicola]|uniref:V-ATPase subunit E n=1 Tax=Capillibacterium thermochitinicola TaxID=2699427 RepID=A0A8J6LLK6_9FIRM|nr:V-type ATP synthase subunit E [Capillibacterium thermochitinicola]MBA2132514.1 hypothetical protein [Capillibacterium thermochitinicola]
MTQELTVLTNRIMEAARKEAAEIAAQSREEAQRLAEDYRKETAEMVKAIREDFRQQGEEEARRLMREAELEMRLRLLQTKQELIHDAFEQAMVTLAEMPEAEKAALYQELLLAAVESGEETVAVSTAEKGLWQRIISQVNQELVKKGRSGKLQLRPEPAPIKGGFLLIGTNYEVNASLESIVADLEERYFPEVAGILFS